MTPLFFGRALSALALCAGLFLVAGARANADCGEHMLATVYAPRLEAAEKVPLTLEYAIKNVGGSYGEPGYLGLGTLDPCPEDKMVARAQAPGTVYTLWVFALEHRKAIASFHFIENGEAYPEDPKVCLPIVRAMLQIDVLTRWTNYTSRSSPQDPKSPLSFVIRHPDFAKVASLYQANAAALGMKLPAAGAFHSADAVQPLYQREMSMRAHLPDGVICDSAVSHAR
jgi:hypothetical protein